MHEASLAADLVCRIKEIAHAQGVQRVLSVRIQVDGWSIFSRDHLQDHFALVSRGTVAEGARLEVKAPMRTASPEEWGYFWRAWR